MKKNITIVGMGYVGLSNAILLSQNNQVKILDVVAEKVNMLNERKSPIKDSLIELYLSKKNLNLVATMSESFAYEGADIVIISTPTNYDETLNYFDTLTVEETVKNILQYNKDAIIIIKSTIPIGFTEQLCRKYNYNKILFSPEFLREGQALYDNLYPSRIIVGYLNEDVKSYAIDFSILLMESAEGKDIPLLYMNLAEAESVKLFSNTYLAMRISYFNELDTFAELKGLNSKDIIEGMGLDPRIGLHYNNPSFGYGGYCLPKDTKQLLSNYNNIPQSLFNSIVESNDIRKQHILNQILLNINPNSTVGIYRLIMKNNSDNFRQSAIFDIVEKLLEYGINVIIYEPLLDSISYLNCEVVNNFDDFEKQSDLIIANRVDEQLKDNSKVYSRDIYNIC